MSHGALCEYCGSQLFDGAPFCGNCGRPIRLIQPQPMSYPPRIPASAPTTQRSIRRWLQSDKNRANALLLLVVILSGALFLTYLQNTDLQSRLAALQVKADAYYSQLQTSQTQAAGYYSQLQTSQTNNALLLSQVNSLQSQNAYLTSQVSSLSLQAAHPTVTMWNSCGGPCTMDSTSWRAGGVPDTFTYYASYAADYPVGMYFLTLSQYVQFANCPSTGYAASLINCVTGTYSYYSPTTSLSGVFHLAEGCASYVAIYYSNYSGTMYPDVSVTYNPASTSTGACV